jgi:hypothetical protein
VAGSAIKNFVTDILMTLAMRNICVLNPKICLPKRTPKAPFLLNFSSIFRGVSAKFYKGFMSNFNANGPGRSNHTIVNRITTNWSLDGNRKSDTSRYWETKKLVAVSMAGKQLQTEEIKTKLNKKRA